MNLPKEGNMYSYKIVHDVSDISPREGDNVAQLILCSKSHFKINETVISNSIAFSRELDEMMIRNLLEQCDPVAAVFPVFAYIHGGAMLSLDPFSCRFDSGIAGFAIVAKYALNEMLGQKRVSKRVRRVVAAELKDLTDFWNGDVYGYQIIDNYGEIFDSDYGYFGDRGREHCELLAKDIVDGMNKEFGLLVKHRLALACAG